MLGGGESSELPTFPRSTSSPPLVLQLDVCGPLLQGETSHLYKSLQQGRALETSAGKCAHGELCLRPLCIRCDPFQWLFPTSPAEVCLGRWLNRSGATEELYGLVGRQNQAWLLNTNCHTTYHLPACRRWEAWTDHQGRGPVSARVLSCFPPKGCVAKETPENFLKRLSKVIKAKYVCLLDSGCLSIKQLTNWLLNGASVLLPFRFLVYFYLLMVSS